MLKVWLETYRVAITGGMLTIGGFDCFNCSFREFLEDQSNKLHATAIKLGVFDRGDYQFVWVVWQSW